MSNVGYATLSVIPSVKGIDKALSEQADPAVERVGKSSGHRFGKVFVAAATAGLVALGGLGIAGAKAGLQTASAMEQANVSFTTMLGSGKKARGFLNDLQQFAAKTPFEFPDLQTAASSLVSVGVKSSKVIPIMTSLGNATAGMGTGSEGIKRATVALQQMSAAGKITGEDLNQLRDAGVPVFDLLAAATGKSKEAVAELAQKGKLGKKELGELFKALETGKGLERFNGLMDKQSQTLAGQFSTLKDTVNMGLSSVVAPWLPFIKQLLGGVSTGASGFFTTLSAKSAELAKHGPEIQAFLSKVAAGVQGLFSLVVKGDFTGKLRQAFGWEEDSSAVDRLLTIRDGVLHVKDSIAGLFNLVVKGDFTGRLRTAFGWEEDSPAVDRILDIRDAVVGLFDQFKSGEGTAKLGKMFSDLTASLPAVGPSLDLIGRSLSFVADHADLVGKALPFLLAGFAAVKASQVVNNAVGRDSIIGFGLQLTSTLALAASNRALAASNRGLASSTVQATAAENAGVFAKGRALFATVAKTVAEKVAAGASKAMAAAQWLVNAALSANPIGLVILALVALGVAVVIAWKKSETFRNVVLGAWSAIRAGVGVVVGWLTVAVPAAFAWIKNAFLRFTPLGIIISHWSQIRSFIAGAVAGIRATIGWFAGLPGRFSSWFGSARNAAVGKLGDLVSWVRGLPSKITGALGDMGGLLLDKGSQIVSGLIEGIRGMGGRLAGFVEQFIKDHIPAPVAKALRIGSPSKVMAEQAKWIPLGIVAGIESQRGRVDEAMRSLVRAPAFPALDKASTASDRRSGEGAGKLDLSEASLQRLAAILAGIKVKATVGLPEFDEALGAAL